MSERRGWAVTGSIGVLAVVTLALAARSWLASMFSDVGPDRAADVVLFALLGACAGVLLPMFAFAGVLLITRTRPAPPAPAREVIDVQPVEWTPALVNGPNSRTMLPRPQLLDLAGRAVRDLRPHTPPTQAAIREAFGVSGGTASAVQQVLREWGVADVRDGAPSAWV